MTAEEWLSRLGSIIADIATRGSEPLAQRELLFGLWSLFMSAPHKIDLAFGAISEPELKAGGLEYGSKLHAGQAINAPPATALLRDKVTFAAQMLRGLEQAYLHGGAHTRVPRGVEEVATRYCDEEGYVLPFAPLFRKSEQVWPGGFARRGLTLVRCIRKNLSTGHCVDLRFGEPLASVDPVRCVAAIFENTTPLGSNGKPIDFNVPGKFVFHGVTLTPATVEQVMHDAMDAGEPADIIVFPELTMPPDRVAEVKHLLRRKPWSQGTVPRGPTLVVAGSWHQSVVGGYANQAPVLASNGASIGCHAKHIPYTNKVLDKSGAVIGILTEDIVPSNSILVIATPNLTMAIGICLDFCQEGSPNYPYSELDVDLVLVPSMGSETTMGSHQTRGQLVWNMRKTATFVSQQSEKGLFGYVYARSASGAESDFVAQQISWRSLVTKG